MLVADFTSLVFAIVELLRVCANGFFSTIRHGLRGAEPDSEGFPSIPMDTSRPDAVISAEKRIDSMVCPPRCNLKGCAKDCKLNHPRGGMIVYGGTPPPVEGELLKITANPGHDDELKCHNCSRILREPSPSIWTSFILFVILEIIVLLESQGVGKILLGLILPVLYCVYIAVIRNRDEPDTGCQYSDHRDKVLCNDCVRVFRPKDVCAKENEWLRRYAGFRICSLCVLKLMIRVRPNLPERFQLNRRGNLQGLVSLLRDAMGDFVKYYGHEISFATSFNFRLEDLESARKANDMPFDTKVWCVIHLLASGFPMGLAFKIAYQGYNVFSPHHQSLVKESLGVLTETDIKNKSFICNRCLDMRYTFPLTSRFPLSPVPCVCSDLFQRVLFLMYLTRSVSSKDEDGKKVYELYNNLVKRLGPLWEKYPGFRQLVQMHIPENFLHWVKGESPKLELLDWSDYRQRPIPKELIPGIIEDIIAKVLRECTH